MRRSGRQVVGAAACVTVLATALTAPASALTPSDPYSYSVDVGHGVQRVTYLGRSFVVPSSWQVIDLTTHPSACVRFDVHAVYLGHPGTAQQCPAHGVGRRTGALLIEPDLTRTTSGTVTTLDHPISAEIDVTAPGLTITASYGDDRTTVVDVLTAAGLPPPATASVAPAALVRDVVPAAFVRDVEPVEVVRGTNQVTGLGFDTCTAPSSKQMDSWAASPFSTIGIYIGGSERACAQPSLNSAWIVERARAGWHFMPLYVGWQAAWDKLTATATTPAPAVLGRESADDAVTHARGLGIGPGALLYYDMESYKTRAQSVAAMAFLSAWTAELHSRGYRSAVYSSASTGIADLVANRGKIAEPDVVAIAHWNGIADADLKATPSDAWPVQRAHQYLGNVDASYGGVKLNIDKDYLSINNVTPIIGAPSGPGTVTKTPAPAPTRTPTPTPTGSTPAVTPTGFTPTPLPTRLTPTATPPGSARAATPTRSTPTATSAAPNTASAAPRATVARAWRA